MAALFTFTVKSAPEIRDDILRGLRAMLRRRGVTNPDVGPDTDYYLTATALSNEIAVGQANGVIKADEQMPDTAEDDDDAGTTALSRIAAILGLKKRAAAGSVGFVVFDATSPSPVVLYDELTDGLGQRYRVTVGGTYADGETIPIEAVATGKATNLAEGTALEWASAPPYSAPKAIVAAGGLVNGTDKETNEELRARVFAFFQNPPASGNWSHIAQTAEESTSRVQKAYVYPAIQGAGSVHVAVTASPTDTNKNRDVASSVMTSTVDPYVKGKHAEHAEFTITTVTNVNADVAFGLTLPEAPTANPPGQGGGWLDGTPWPRIDGTTTFRVTVTAVTSSTRFTCDAQTAPIAGVHHISWLSPTEWRLYTARVTTVHSSTPGAVEVTIDAPFAGLTNGCYVWPASEQQDDLVASVIAAFGLMGPGEKSANASALVRGFRHPRSSAAYPYTLGAHLNAALLAIDAVEVAQFLHRTDGTTTSTGPSGAVSPQVPVSVTNPPNQYVPRHIGFYRLP